MVFVSINVYEYLIGSKRIVSIWNKMFALLIVSTMLVIVRRYLPMLTVVLFVLLLSFLYSVVYTKKFVTSVFVTVISISINYMLYALSVIVSIPVTRLEYLLIANTNLDVYIEVVFALTISVFQILLMLLVFRIKRLRSGIPNIINKVSGSLGFFISCVVVLLASLLFKTDSDNYTPVYPIIVLFVCLLGFIAYLWWCKRITNNYLNKVQQRNLDMAEQTIAKQKEEIEYLSKIVHKDNKLIGALELSLQEVEGVDMDKLSAMSKERESILHTYKEGENMMQKTGVFSIDMMLNYLLKRAFDKNAEFDVVVNGNVKYMVENIINEDDLSTLLADIGENAVIAVSGEERKNILLSIGVRDNSYYIDVYDSGAPFNVNVIENYGRTRYTTHKTTGGSGIGLMQTKELLSKYKASFEIEEIENNSLYTKRVSIVFDSLLKTRIFTNRQEILELRTQRDDIIFSEITVNK